MNRRRRMTGLIAMLVAVILVSPGVLMAPGEAGVKKKNVVKQSVKVKYGNAAAGAINGGGYRSRSNINVNTNSNQNTNIIKIQR